MKKTFVNEDFPLNTKTARELYHGYAEKMPIIDYHCHLQPKEIAEDGRWTDVADVWLGDHYKWRQMRTCGFAERLCSGRGTDGSAGGKPFENPVLIDPVRCKVWDVKALFAPARRYGAWELKGIYALDYPLFLTDRVALEK